MAIPMDFADVLSILLTTASGIMYNQNNSSIVAFKINALSEGSHV